ncbi:hypothetical protein AAEX28_04740 [Lentisphaerota bacterium WC36G]|nr:hypothetical protein LJT99_07600 [Lentisphaerae bacterium WC36]
MTVEAEKPLIVYTANGTSNEFPITFNFIDKNHVKVLLNDLELQNGIDYTVNDNTAIFAVIPTQNSKVLIKRNTPIEQTSFDSGINTKTSTKAVEAALDAVTMAQQEIQNQNDSTLKVVTAQDLNLEIVSQELANKVVCFDENNNLIVRPKSDFDGKAFVFDDLTEQQKQELVDLINDERYAAINHTHEELGNGISANANNLEQHKNSYHAPKPNLWINPNGAINQYNIDNALTKTLTESNYWMDRHFWDIPNNDENLEIETFKGGGYNVTATGETYSVIQGFDVGDCANLFGKFCTMTNISSASMSKQIILKTNDNSKTILNPTSLDNNSAIFDLTSYNLADYNEIWFKFSCNATDNNIDYLAVNEGDKFYGVAEVETVSELFRCQKYYHIENIKPTRSSGVHLYYCRFNVAMRCTPAQKYLAGDTFKIVINDSLGFYVTATANSDKDHWYAFDAELKYAPSQPSALNVADFTLQSGSISDDDETAYSPLWLQKEGNYLRFSSDQDSTHWLYDLATPYDLNGLTKNWSSGFLAGIPYSNCKYYQTSEDELSVYALYQKNNHDYEIGSIKRTGTTPLMTDSTVFDTFINLNTLANKTYSNVQYCYNSDFTQIWCVGYSSATNNELIILDLATVGDASSASLKSITPLGELDGGYADGICLSGDEFHLLITKSNTLYQYSMTAPKDENTLNYSQSLANQNIKSSVLLTADNQHLYISNNGIIKHYLAPGE